jgi:hypothetical protein
MRRFKKDNFEKKELTLVIDILDSLIREITAYEDIKRIL